MNAITLGNPSLFVKGIVDVMVTDYTTGNIIGYDKVLSESAITSSINMGEITGSVGNVLLINIPDTTRITGTLTSQAFSLQQRALASGGTLNYNGVCMVCETVTANSSTITVTGTPTKAYSQPSSDTNYWCYIRQKGASQFSGENYQINSDGEVQNFTAQSGTTYEVIYFTVNASAQVLTLKSNFIPSVVSLQYKYNVYCKQNDQTSQGALYGYLYFIVPRAQFSGDIGISANQTDNAKTNYDWTAISKDDAVSLCPDCNNDSSDYAYYVFVPCNTSAIENLAIIGAGLTLAVEETAQVPVKYVMIDGSLVQPNFSDLTFESEATGTATVGTNTGIVEGVAAGDTNITVTYNNNGTTLTAICPVTVE